MFTPQTISEYLENPMGKGSTAISNRNLIKTDLDARYQKLIERYKDFKHSFYYDKTDFFAHIQIPSETKRENTYDVVIQFIPPSADVANEVNLNRYVIKVFSNCPSFTFTYAYVYNDYDLMVDFLKNKYRNIVLKDNPATKNPGEIINYDKSIYFACKYLQSNKKLLNKVTLVPLAKRINKVEFAKTIRTTDTIDLEIKKENNRLKEAKGENLRKLQKYADSKKRSSILKIAGVKKAKSKNDHRITPKPKIQGKAKVKSTVKK